MAGTPVFPSPLSPKFAPRKPPPWRGGACRTDWRRYLVVLALAILAVAPVLHLWIRATGVQRDIAYWDEYDTAIALVLKLADGLDGWPLLAELVGVNNEHRIVASRVLFAVLYWSRGTLDFVTVGMIGNSTVVALGLVLVAAVRPGARRLRLAVLLGLLLFQLEHYENFLWSGSSIDHCTVVLAGAAALAALQRGTRLGNAGAGLLAVVATFTLAQGLAVWPAGVALLALGRRWRELAGWIGFGALVAGLFLAGFRANGAQQFAEISAVGAARVGWYWVTVLGAVPACGHGASAPYLGALLLLLLGVAVARGAARHEPLALAVTIFALVGTALIAVGRAEAANGIVQSRYYIPGAVAWALTLFLLIERHTHPRRPYRVLAGLLPALFVFHVQANRAFADAADSWITCRDLAAVSFHAHGADGRGAFHLHPAPHRSTALLRRAAAAGIYRLAPVCDELRFPADARESARMHQYVETVSVTDQAVAMAGWAALPGRVARRGDLRIFLRSPEGTHLFSTVSFPRPDVPAVMKQPGWRFAGFQFARNRHELPTGRFEIGVLIEDRAGPEYRLTGQYLTLAPPTPGVVAAAGAAAVVSR
jgi:hypothetical protein